MSLFARVWDGMPESGFDHAMYRQYSSTFGRWTTPDPYGGSYNFANPQSLNRYAYVNRARWGRVIRAGWILARGVFSSITPETRRRRLRLC